jgi:hypothetical protein
MSIWRTFLSEEVNPGPGAAVPVEFAEPIAKLTETEKQGAE